MHGQVLKDKSKIEETVNKLIEHKREALQKTWQKVNGCVKECLCYWVSAYVMRTEGTLAPSLETCYRVTFVNSRHLRAWTLQRGSK